MLIIRKQLIYSVFAIFSASLAIFFKKKAILSDILPLDLLIQFMTISAIILSANLFLFHKKQIKNTKKAKLHDWGILFSAGTFLFVAYLLTTFGLCFTSSINYGFIIKSNLIFTTILSCFFLKEKIYPEKIILIFISFIGIYIFTTRAEIIIPKIGDSLILIGAFFISSFIVIQKKLSKTLSPEIISCSVSSIGAVLAIFTGLIIGYNSVSINFTVFYQG